MIIRLEKSREKIGKSLKNSKSADNFGWSEMVKNSITFDLNNKGSKDSCPGDSKS
jgi:hypothetical protein